MNNKCKIISFLEENKGLATISCVATFINSNSYEVLHECDKLVNELGKIEIKGNNKLHLKKIKDDLDVSLINELIEEKNAKIYIYDCLDSSNSYVKEHINELDNLSVIIPRTQTMGRGRSNRSFFSYKGGLYLSILLKEDSFRNIDFSVDSSFLTAASSIAIIRTLNDLLKDKCQIKWVNDIYLKNKKVAGILAESKNDEKGNLNYCLGIGINVSKTKFPKEIASRAGYLDKMHINRSVIVASIIDNLVDILTNFDKGKIREEYSSYLFIKDKDVIVYNLITKAKKDAKVLDVNDKLELEVIIDNKKVTLMSEEVRLKVEK